MAVPVSDQDVDQARAEVIAGVDLLARALVQPDEEVEGVLDLPASGDAVLDTFFQQTQHSGEDGPELAKARIVRHGGELRRGMEHPDRFEQRRNHQGGAGMRGAGDILDDVAKDRLPRLGIEHPGRILVHGAKDPRASVAALEPQVLRLLATATALRLEPAVEGPKVEYRHLDGSGPQIPPLRPEEDAGQPSRFVARTRREGPARWP